MGNLRKKGLALAKILFSVLLLYLVFDRIPFREVWGSVRESRPGYLLLALAFFVGSKAIAALRLNGYFRQIGVPLSHHSNFRLYLLGMFYNLFLPGGIGGDAYKGYALHRAFGSPVKRLVSVLLLDRLSGLYLLVVYAGLLLLILSPAWADGFTIWLVPALLASLAVYLFVHRRFFPRLQPVFWKSLGYSACVQLAQLGAAACILLALGIREGMLPYLLVFLLSSIVAVLPITIGGIGSRELVFYFGASWLGLQEDTAIGVSMVFFAITALVSLTGVYYHFRKPQLQLREGASLSADESAPNDGG